MSPRQAQPEQDQAKNSKPQKHRSSSGLECKARTRDFTDDLYVAIPPPFCDDRPRDSTNQSEKSQKYPDRAGRVPGHSRIEKACA
ncbi:hypothetical protein Srut_56790 [Streptomyces rutgersensis]|nr:hypothetical protein Srut_56790 [Streptomyces rutgersensis]